MSGMSQDQIAQMFRQNKLQQADRQRKIMQNWAEPEQLSAHDKEIDARAKEQLAKQSLEFDAEMLRLRDIEFVKANAVIQAHNRELAEIESRKLGYWRRLWNALLNK